jgi:hypothetical protein
MSDIIHELEDIQEIFEYISQLLPCEKIAIQIEQADEILDRVIKRLKEGETE